MMGVVSSTFDAGCFRHVYADDRPEVNERVSTN
jgi:hypothetical protein